MENSGYLKSFVRAACVALPVLMLAACGSADEGGLRDRPPKPADGAVDRPADQGARPDAPPDGADASVDATDQDGAQTDAPPSATDTSVDSADDRQDGTASGDVLDETTEATSTDSSADSASDGADDGGSDGTNDAASDDANADARDACVPSPAGERCNGADDDCDGIVDEGFIGVGDSCAVGVGACRRSGVNVCSSDGLAVVCSATEGTPGQELCGNQIDDDCDGSTDEGFPTLGNGCSTGTGACRRDGQVVCTADLLDVTCNAVAGSPTTELCNGADDDCDGTIDNGNPGGGGSCTTSLPGVCAAGHFQCQSGNLRCVEDTTGSPETCNGLDDDCDGSTDETFPGLGNPCDGPDGDLCDEGTNVCNTAGTGTICNDNTSTNTEICDSVDNDCDGSIDEGFSVGQPCDGPDSDLCAEGTWQCNASGGRTCSDNTSSTVEVCNNADDDCDGSIDEGFNKQTDVNNCGSCGHACTNPHGSTVCSNGTCNPTCTFGFTGCDGNLDNGCEGPTDHNANLACTGGPSIGSVRGDNPSGGSDTITRTGFTEARFHVGVTEDNNGCTYLSAEVLLDSPPGVDYDLYVKCTNCSGLERSSTSSGQGGIDSIVTWHGDSCFGEDSGYDLEIEVRYFGAQREIDCTQPWNLTVSGNIAAVSSDLCCGDC